MDLSSSRADMTSKHLADRVDELRSALRFQDPSLIAARSGVHYHPSGADRGELHVPLWGKTCIFSWPDLIGSGEPNEPLPDFQQALLLYYLRTADGTPLAENWISFAELPDGRMYNTAFQGYTGDELVKTFSLDLETFKKACDRTGGQKAAIGSAAFIFNALPRIPMMVTYWLGDEDFPSSCKILFDASVPHYLPTDACAILGSMLTRKLLRH